MKKILLLLVLVIIIFIGLVTIKTFSFPPFSFPPLGWKAELVNPMGFKSVSPTPVASTLVPVPSPKTFEFNNSTDLKEELQKVNPEVLDSDFN